MTQYMILIYESEAGYATAPPDMWQTAMEAHGRFAETKEALGGFNLIEARDLDHALAIGKLCPAPYGGVEVRPVMDTSGGPPQA